MGKTSTRTKVERSSRSASQRASAGRVATHDARVVLGNRSTRMLLLQPKLTVGASYDPLEIEADRIATDVVRAMRSTATTAAADHECGDGCAVHGSGRAAARTISRASDHVCGDGCAVHSSRPPVVRTIRRHAGHDHHHHDDGPIGAGGGDVHAADESAVNRARGGGSALPAEFRSQVEPIMGADFSSVRVHTGSASAQLNRSFGASAFTIGNDIFFRDGMPNVASREGAHLVSHELTHTIQQGGTPTVARCACGATNPHIQRHSSFEHLMLGNVPPTQLATIGAWQDAIKQTESKRSGLTKKRDKQAARVDVDMEDGSTLHIDKANIMHVLLQEMIRLKDWQKDPPKESSAEGGNKVGQSMVQIGKDPKYDVMTVMLPQGILCTYGEMNTLGDYYGSVEVMKGADARAVWQLLQSVRDETWGFLSNTYNKVAESLTSTEHQDPRMKGIRDTLMDEFIVPELQGEGVGFEGAMLPRISGMMGQIELLKGVQSTGAQGDTNKYMPSLGRNACHFVPESWNAWAKNHKDAIALANRSWQKYLLSEHAKAQLNNPDQDTRQLAQDEFEKKKAEATELANEAMMTNGFGDHFLQDSYAAGHMINKTQIMQFYVEYIDAHDKWDYFKDANWQKVQNIAYTQTLAPPRQYDTSRVEGYAGATGPNANKGMDPQSVENRSDGDWRTNFTELGLKVPRSLSNDAASPTRKLLQKMRLLARGGKESLKGTEIIAEMDKMDVGVVQARMAVADMVLDGVLLSNVNVTKRGRQMASMRDKRARADLKGGAALGAEGAGEALDIKEFRKGVYQLRPELRPKKGSAPQPMTEAESQESYAAITYNDYLQFIQSSFLQKSTNALHDTFCQGGLTVYDGLGGEIGRVYGDDAMFSANSSMGVAHSGTTSQMSRDSIVNIINTGADGGISVQSIVDRFPRQVRADVYNSKGKVIQTGVAMPFEAWHDPAEVNSLKAEANRRIFGSMDWGIAQKFAPGVLSPELGTFFSAPAPHVPF